jgi:hypothetical protein
MFPQSFAKESATAKFIPSPILSRRRGISPKSAVRSLRTGIKVHFIPGSKDLRQQGSEQLSVRGLLSLIGLLCVLCEL